MVSLSAFARGRNIEPKTVSIYMKRHNMPYDKAKGLSEEQIATLEEIYPIPKPVVIVNGLDSEEERALRQELEEAYRKLDIAKDKILELTEQTAVVKFLQDKSEEQNLKIEKQEQEIERLKHRNLISRILNK